MEFNFDKRKAGRYIATILIAAVIFGGGFSVGQKTKHLAAQPGTVDFSLFWDAYNKLHTDFITKGNISDQKIIYGAIDGMTKSLGDPYTDFFAPTQAKAFQQQ